MAADKEAFKFIFSFEKIVARFLFLFLWLRYLFSPVHGGFLNDMRTVNKVEEMLLIEEIVREN